MTGQPKIKVVQQPSPQGDYRVIQTVNTVIVDIGQYLTKIRVVELVSLGFDVTIVEAR